MIIPPFNYQSNISALPLAINGTRLASGTGNIDSSPPQAAQNDIKQNSTSPLLPVLKIHSIRQIQKISFG